MTPGFKVTAAVIPVLMLTARRRPRHPGAGLVIPAQAGIQKTLRHMNPAHTGMPLILSFTYPRNFTLSLPPRTVVS